MICKKCGQEVDSSMEYCPFCGEKLHVIDAEVVANENVKEEEHSTAAYNVFAIIGFVAGIVALASSWFFGGFGGIVGIIFGSIGKKSNDPDKVAKAQKGINMSIWGLVISTVIMILFFALMFVVGTNSEI